MQHQCGQFKTMKSGLSAVSGSVVRIDGCIASMKVAHFFYFSIAARHRSFRRAAIDLNITQPTLSKRIRELEDQFDVLLFERRAGGARLTPPGEKFVQSADRILAELEFMKQSAQAAKRGDLGRIDVGFYTSLSAGALRDTLVAFANQHAEAELNIIEETRAALLTRRITT
jgi:DNA-binding transcriptional LysR family regulator